MFCGYVGSSYRGLQIQRAQGEGETVEAVLEKALYLAGHISEHNYGDLKKVRWTRSSRTDKGVHSVCTVLSLRMLVDVGTFDESDYSADVAANINAHLPEEVRVFCVQRVTKSFTARHGCRDRTYHYFLPLKPIMDAFNRGDGGDKEATADEVIERLRGLLALYRGNHPFHNYTDRRVYSSEKKKMPERVQVYYAPRHGTGSDSSAAHHSDDAEASVTAVVEAASADSVHVASEAAVGTSTGDERAEAGASASSVSDERDGDDRDEDGEENAAASSDDVNDGGARRISWSFPRRCWWNEHIDDSDPIVLQHYRQVYKFWCSDVIRIRNPQFGDPSDDNDALETLRIEITGGSFMLHQIRYMIGTVVGVLLGHLPPEIIPATLSAPSRFNFLPLAPSSSLLLFDATFHQLRTPSGAEKRYLRFDDKGIELRDDFTSNVLFPNLFPIVASDEWAKWIAMLPRAHESYYDASHLTSLLEKHSEWRTHRIEAAIERRRRREEEEEEEDA